MMTFKRFRDQQSHVWYLAINRMSKRQGLATIRTASSWIFKAVYQPRADIYLGAFFRNFEASFHPFMGISSRISLLQLQVYPIDRCFFTESVHFLVSKHSELSCPGILFATLVTKTCRLPRVSTRILKETYFCKKKKKNTNEPKNADVSQHSDLM